MKLRIHPEATAELDAAASWYQRQEPRLDLGAELLAEVSRALIIIADSPDTWPLAGSRSLLRRFLLSRFPYAILYAHQDDEVRVFAVAHTSRRPGYWVGRSFD